MYLQRLSSILLHVRPSKKKRSHMVVFVERWIHATSYLNDIQLISTSRAMYNNCRTDCISTRRVHVSCVRDMLVCLKFVLLLLAPARLFAVRDPWAVLELSPGASRDEVKKVTWKKTEKIEWFDGLDLRVGKFEGRECYTSWDRTASADTCSRVKQESRTQICLLDRR